MPFARQTMRADPVYAAYSFVDHIDRFETGKRAHATFSIPVDIASFPSCLVAEAVGQLAAWVAMDRIDFRGRPVAALATYLAAWYLLQGYGNTGLWISLLIFLMSRGLYQAARFPALARRSFIAKAAP